ncbi:MAG: TraR/DksA family transcriptional regulator [Nitrospiraceae bacterium]
MTTRGKPSTKRAGKGRSTSAAVAVEGARPEAEPATIRPNRPKESAKAREEREQRRDSLQRILLSKRHEIMKEIEGSLGQSLTEDQQRRLESARDIGDQALMDLERELGISLMEMRNRKRQLIDEALRRLVEGTYGLCAECGVEISEKRLAAVPFARLCVECQSRQELLEKIEREEERD